MAKIVKLEIKNYRGIKNLNLDFNPNDNVICLIGRGDGGKTSVLEAISAVLSPAWNLLFTDSDFFNCDISNPIEIKVSLLGTPEKLLDIEKFGLHVRLYDEQNQTITDDVTNQEESIHIKELLTIKLFVDQSLEPKWTVVNSRSQEEKAINSNERGLFNCCMISDSIDRHFSWTKGNPLYSLLKTVGQNSDKEETNIILESLRKAKIEIDRHTFEELQYATMIVTQQAQALGLNIGNTRTSLDFKEIAIKEGKISLHENLVPFRLKGKGSKRLASLAIQLALVQEGGIMLVDEIEQGLEPDRIKHLIRAFKENNNGQVFITTHSREVISELGNEPLCLLLKNNSGAKLESRRLSISNLTSVVRACPEAFFANKVIVCEGATEVGICRALDQYRIRMGNEPMAFLDCAYIDGTGNTLVERVKGINEINIKTALLCDSDDLSVNKQKENLREKGITIFDCEDGAFLEKQVFRDLPWSAIQELITYALKVHKKNITVSLEDAIKAKLPTGHKLEVNWQNVDTPILRETLANVSVSKGSEWFKRIDHGEYLGSIIFKHYGNINENAYLKRNLSSLIEWIDTK